MHTDYVQVNRPVAQEDLMMAEKTSQFQSPLLTGAGAAAYLSIGRSHFYALQRAGQITAVRIGGSVRYRRADLDALIAASAQTA